MSARGLLEVIRDECRGLGGALRLALLKCFSGTRGGQSGRFTEVCGAGAVGWGFDTLTFGLFRAVFFNLCVVFVIHRILRSRA